MLSGFSFSSIFTAGGLAKLGQIIVGDLTMAGDNVVIMGSLASGLPEKDRKRVLLLGVGMALAFLITFAVIATQLLPDRAHLPLHQGCSAAHSMKS